MISRAIVRRPGRSIVSGLTTASLGEVDYDLAVAQHEAYIRAIRSCGVEVTVLPPDEAFPDSTFVEDVAVLSERCAVITRPGADSRLREIENMVPVLNRFYSDLKVIEAPGTLEGGDVMRVGDHFYVGLSGRTNISGAAQLAQYLEKYGYRVTTVPVENFLHLKTGVTYLGDNIMLVADELRSTEYFREFRQIAVAPEESYAANCLRINDFVLVPDGFPGVLASLLDMGFCPIVLDVSEFRKVDGGLTCLSLRY